MKFIQWIEDNNLTRIDKEVVEIKNSYGNLQKKGTIWVRIDSTF